MSHKGFVEISPLCAVSDTELGGCIDNIATPTLCTFGSLIIALSVKIVRFAIDLQAAY